MKHDVARRNMVECQLRTNKLTAPRLIEAFETVPRERFVPEAKRGVAYIDQDLEVAPGRYLLDPMVLARLLQAAAIEPSDVVLDIGCATGYSAAILAQVAGTVVALESDPTLAEQANRTLGELEIDNVVVVEGALRDGYPKQAPYGAVLLAGAVAELPEGICAQLAEGGRLVTVLRDRPGLGQGTLFRCLDGQISKRSLFDAATPLLTEFVPKPSFVF
ncbi:MAG: protein-L-isoaspartate O-methyltransferase [Pseudomonadota bacterium]